MNTLDIETLIESIKKEVIQTHLKTYPEISGHEDFINERIHEKVIQKITNLKKNIVDSYDIKAIIWDSVYHDDFELFTHIYQEQSKHPDTPSNPMEIFVSQTLSSLTPNRHETYLIRENSKEVMTLAFQKNNFRVLDFLITHEKKADTKEFFLQALPTLFYNDLENDKNELLLFFLSKDYIDLNKIKNDLIKHSLYKNNMKMYEHFKGMDIFKDIEDNQIFGWAVEALTLSKNQGSIQIMEVINHYLYDKKIEVNQKTMKGLLISEDNWEELMSMVKKRDLYFKMEEQHLAENKISKKIKL